MSPALLLRCNNKAVIVAPRARDPCSPKLSTCLRISAREGTGAECVCCTLSWGILLVPVDCAKHARPACTEYYILLARPSGCKSAPAAFASRLSQAGPAQAEEPRVVGSAGQIYVGSTGCQICSIRQVHGFHIHCDGHLEVLQLVEVGWVIIVEPRS
jgi:hypothetical protein